MRLPERDTIYNRIILVLVCIPVMQTLLCHDMPGINADVALKGISAYKIMHGETIGLRGETPYTGSLRIYLTSLIFRIGGVNRLSLELALGIYNSLTLLFVYLLAKRILSARAGIICAVVVSCAPWFVVKDPENWQYLMLVAALYLLVPPQAARKSQIPNPKSQTYEQHAMELSSKNPRAGGVLTALMGGIVIGLGCYEHQLTAIIPLSLLVAYVVYRGGRGMAWGRLALILAGCAAGFLPRIVYSLTHGIPVHMEALNSPSKVARDAATCVPYFLSLLNGSVVYLAHTGRIRFWVAPVNAALFFGSLCALLFRGKKNLAYAIVALLLMLYLLPLTVVKYTTMRYFFGALMTAALISGAGIYVVSCRYAITGMLILLVYAACNIFYIAENFYVEFGETGGSLTIFETGNVFDASHHLVRTDILYECLDKTVPVIVAPEPFIATPLRFYDLGHGNFKVITGRIDAPYDSFYFIDYANGGKLGITIVPSRFPEYTITMECPKLTNFSVYRFTRESTGHVAPAR